MSVSPVSRQAPAGGSHPRSNALRAFVEYAVLAPSSHNSQPWRFVVDDDALTLEADTSRALRVADPQDRELVISCGAALAFLRVAIRHAGYEEVVHRFPRPSNPDHLARVSLGERRRADDAADELFAAMAHRRTNRRPFEARPVPTATIEALVATVRAEGGWIRPVTSAEEKDAVAELISRGDRMQGADPAYRRELSAWLRSSAGRARDGVPGTAFGMGTLTSIPFPLFIRLVDWGRVQAARDREIVSHSPAAALRNRSSACVSSTSSMTSQIASLRRFTIFVARSMMPRRSMYLLAAISC